MTVELGATLFKAAFIAYLAATLCYVAYLINEKKAIGSAGTAILAAGWLLHTASLVVRTDAAQRPPFLNLYEYTLSVTWGAVLVYMVLERVTKSRGYGAFSVPLITLFTFLATLLPTEVNPTMPALKSAWRVPHVATAILAYSAFGIAFGMAIMYLIQERSEGKQTFWTTRMPPLKTLDQVIYRMIAFGFLMQTALVVTGAIWAQFAWGKYWSWDPKETWSLITWLIYAVYFHTRVTMGWRGHKSAIVVAIGFIAMLFTLLGVNLLLPGLHSYA